MKGKKIEQDEIKDTSGDSELDCIRKVKVKKMKYGKMHCSRPDASYFKDWKTFPNITLER